MSQTACHLFQYDESHSETSVNVVNINAGDSFVDELAHHLLHSYEGDDLGLSKLRVLLPTRRACQALQEAFLRQTSGRAVILPQMMPVFAPDEDALTLLAGLDVSDLPPAIDPTKRLLLLMPLIKQAFPESLNTAQALSLAEHLARFIDNLYIEDLSLNDLDRLAPDDPKLSHNWQKTVTFLKQIIAEFWPDILAQTGCVDIGQYRVSLINAYTEYWREHPPTDPVIIAGTMASIPSLANMIREVLKNPTGIMVLAGLDHHIDDESWDNLEEGHPQYLFKQLLSRLDISRQDIQQVKPLAPLHQKYASSPPQIRSKTLNARRVIASEMMRPPATLQKWDAFHDLTDEARAGLENGLEGLHLAEVKNSFHEARLIACIIRDSLDQPEHTVTVITPNRKLAKLIQKEMLFWGIHIDDSAGQPLAQTTIGRFLLSLCRLVKQKFDPLSLLNVFKNTHMRGGANFPSDISYKAFITAMELEFFRGFKEFNSLESLHNLVEHRWGADDKHARKLDAWRALYDIFQPLNLALNGQKDIFPYQSLRAIIEAMEALSSTPDQNGTEQLWQGDDGEQAAQFLTQILDSLREASAMNLHDLHDFILHLMEGLSVRPKFGIHPRIRLLGLAEARLQVADTLILAGLNEGSWPSDPGHNPWMSRPMIKDYGFPSPERALSQSAHDFIQGFCNQTVYLTRALSSDGALTVPSRWVSRFKTIRETAKIELNDHIIRRHIQRSLLHPLSPVKDQNIQRPAPQLQGDATINRLSITDVGALISDPYAFYAKRVLRLRPLDPIDQAPDYLLRGQIMHEGLEMFTKSFPKALPKDPEAELLKIGQDIFSRFQDWSAELHGFWWSAFVAMAHWFASVEQQWRTHGQDIFSELSCDHMINTERSTIRLTGRADRIEKHQDGWVIIDYKTGAPPSAVDIYMGHAPQLPLTGALVLKGGFDKLDKHITPNTSDNIKALQYWKISGRSSAVQNSGKSKSIPVNETELCQDALNGTTALLETYNDNFAAFLSYPFGTAKAAPFSGDYQHLSRVNEWSVSDEAAANDMEASA